MNGNKELNLSRGSIVYIPPESAYDIDILDKGDKNGEVFTAYIAMYNYYKN